MLYNAVCKYAELQTAEK